MWETVDPDGRTVILEDRGWEHILRKHPELGVGREVILDTVAGPDRRASGRSPNEGWFYRRGAGPSRWVKVVVHYERDRGVIATAFPRRSFP